MEEKYFKITNENENHNGFQYVDGLNVLDKPFQAEGSCVSGGLYFSDAENILKFLSYGIYLREISLPTDDPDFKMVEDPAGRKWRANKIILGERRNLAERSTWEYLSSFGSEYIYYAALKWALINGSLDVINFLIERNDDFGLSQKIYILDKASKYGHIEIIKFFLTKYGIDLKQTRVFVQASTLGHLEIVKFLIEKDNFESEYEFAMRCASENGHLEVVKYLTEKGANPKNHENIKSAAQAGHLEVVKFLIGNGANFKVDNNYPIRWAARNGHLNVVKFLVKNGADFKAKNNAPIRWAAGCGRLEIVKFLVEKGADFKAKNNAAICEAAEYGELEMVKFLVEKGADFKDRNNRAIQLASNNGYTEVVDYLKKMGAVNPFFKLQKN